MKTHNNDDFARLSYYKRQNNAAMLQ